MTSPTKLAAALAAVLFAVAWSPQGTEGGRDDRDPSPLAETSAAAPAQGSYAWPVRGPVLRPFEEPDGPYGAGHRGIDIGAALATPVLAAQDGVVAFAGRIAGSLFVSIDHPDGVRTTYSWLSLILVVEGEGVLRGQTIAHAGHGHENVASPHLHFGARFEDAYIDPMLLLEPAAVVGLIFLAPLRDPSTTATTDPSGDGAAREQGSGVEPMDSARAPPTPRPADGLRVSVAASRPETRP